MKTKFPSPTRLHPTTPRHTHIPTHYALLAQGAHRVTINKHSKHAHTSSLLQTPNSSLTYIAYCENVIVSNLEKLHKHTHTSLKTQHLLSTELVIYPPHCHETLETNMAQNGLIEKSKNEN